MRFALAIMTSIFGGFWSVFFKKATTLNKSWPWVNIFLGYHIVFTLGVLSLIFGWIRGPGEVFEWGYLVFFLSYMLLYYALSPLEQKAMMTERLSSLQPFGNVGKLIAIVCGFIVLWERNIVTFIVAILAFVCTMIYASRWRKHRLSKGVFYYIGSQCIRWVMAVFIAMMLTENDLIGFQMSELELVSYEGIFSVVILLSMFVSTRKLWLFAQSPKQYYAYRYGGCLVGDMGWLLWLFLIAELGIITSSILSLITIATTLTMGYFFLHDRPEKRDIMFALFIIFLICIGYIFRNVTI